MRSAHGPDDGRQVTTLPRTSVSANSSGARPATYCATCCTSGNARPMLSASTIGSPIWAAQAAGSSPLEPPISDDITATALRPVTPSRWSRSRMPSSPLGSFSTPTVGAPMPPSGSSKPSGSRSSSVTTSTGPNTRSASSRISEPV